MSTTGSTISRSEVLDGRGLECAACASVQERLVRLQAEREQLLEACAVLSALNQALQNELHTLRIERASAGP